MKLDDVAEAMKPGVAAAIEKGLNYQEMMMALRLAACREALRRTGNNYRAARLLQMSVGYFHELMNGRRLKDTAFNKGGKNGVRARQRKPVETEQKAS
jgi:hypothetical protein